MTNKPGLSILDQTFSICRLDPTEALPGWLSGFPFWAAVQTREELSLVVPESTVVDGWKAEHGWRCIKLAGPIDFNLTGVLTGLCTPLAEQGLSIFAISTYDTDYVLVRKGDLEKARLVLIK